MVNTIEIIYKKGDAECRKEILAFVKTKENKNSGYTSYIKIIDYIQKELNLMLMIGN